MREGDKISMSDDPLDASRSLEQIENDYWRVPPPDTTRLVKTVHRLRRAPVGELQPEDLRLLVSQNVGLSVVVPIALRLIRDNPMVEGDLYPGDLLVAVLNVPRSYWRDHAEHCNKLVQVVVSRSFELDEFEREISSFLKQLE